MAKLHPFQAIRPDLSKVEKVASKPYDVLDADEAREEVKDNPYSFLHVVKPEVDLDSGIDPHDPRVYQKARENLELFLEKKYLVQDPESTFYLYRQEWKGHVQTGIVACFSVEEYQTGLIKKHEFTRKQKEDDRVQNILHTNCNTGPVFLTFRQVPSVAQILLSLAEQSPLYDFLDEASVHHTVFRVSDPEVCRQLQQQMEKVECLYIADGHHRAASASRVREIKKEQNPSHSGTEEYNWFLGVLFPHDQLQILDYNRVVRDLGTLSEDRFLALLSNQFEVKKAARSPFRPIEKHSFGMFLGGTWYDLTAKSGSFSAEDPVEQLDVSILQKNVLSPLLGIEDPRSDERIHFVGGIRGLGELEKLVLSGKWAVAFSLFPTSMEDLLQVADAGKVMPPKSTWFEPKLKSGLFLHRLDS
ncbi:MAG TPA: DUF1015 family protein [Thermotogota bacterium]|nr:DUF1015 family protein [Thermotogota bacterium]HRW91831.1 DUF1015 family protein [Thermotogota bacterium]